MYDFVLTCLLDGLLDCVLDRFITLYARGNFYAKEEMEGAWETRNVISVSELIERCVEGALVTGSPAVA